MCRCDCRAEDGTLDSRADDGTLAATRRVCCRRPWRASVRSSGPGAMPGVHKPVSDGDAKGERKERSRKDSRQERSLARVESGHGAQLPMARSGSCGAPARDGPARALPTIALTQGRSPRAESQVACGSGINVCHESRASRE